MYRRWGPKSWRHCASFAVTCAHGSPVGVLRAARRVLPQGVRWFQMNFSPLPFPTPHYFASSLSTLGPSWCPMACVFLGWSRSVCKLCLTLCIWRALPMQSLSLSHTHTHINASLVGYTLRSPWCDDLPLSERPLWLVEGGGGDACRLVWRVRKSKRTIAIHTAYSFDSLLKRRWIYSATFSSYNKLHYQKSSNERIYEWAT